MMGEQVVMIAGTTTAPVASIAVVALRVTCCYQTLVGDAPLYCDVGAAIDREAFVDAPADRAVVDDDILAVHTAQSVAFVLGDVTIAKAEPHISDDDVVGV